MRCLIPLLATMMLNAHAAPVLVELKIEPIGKPNRTIFCVVTNRSKRAVTAWTGYDGKHNILVSRMGFPIGLRPDEPGPMKQIRIAPGESRTLYELSMQDVLLLRRMAGGRFGYSWGWHESPPRGAPPMSPIHHSRGSAWEARREDSGILSAEVEIDGAALSSADTEFSLKQKKGEAVTILVKCSQAYDAAHTRDLYQFHAETVNVLSGKYESKQVAFTLHDNQGARHFLGQLGAKRDAQSKMYDCRGRLVRIEFEYFPVRGGIPRLIVKDYEVIEPASQRVGE